MPAVTKPSLICNQGKKAGKSSIPFLQIGLSKCQKGAASYKIMSCSDVNLVMYGFQFPFLTITCGVQDVCLRGKFSGGYARNDRRQGCRFGYGGGERVPTGIVGVPCRGRQGSLGLVWSLAMLKPKLHP